VYSQADKPDQRFSKASLAASEKQNKKIRQELRHFKNHDWAGDYYFGDGLGVNVSLVLAPGNGFVFTRQGCVGLYDINYGDVTFTNGALRLLFKYPNRKKGFEWIAPVLLPVRWGQRHYLIAVDKIVDFTNAINAGTEPNSLFGFGGQSWSFLLRRGDEDKTVSGQPNLPKEFLSYILAEPITARISSVDQPRVENSRRITQVNIDVGTAEGLKEGMELYVHRPSGIFASAVVTNVSEHSAKAVIEQLEPTDPQLTDPPPAPHWELSTKSVRSD
jgi:hypothetical protein